MNHSLIYEQRTTTVCYSQTHNVSVVALFGTYLLAEQSNCQYWFSNVSNSILTSRFSNCSLKPVSHTQMNVNSYHGSNWKKKKIMDLPELTIMDSKINELKQEVY